jgi:hypothetical protein
LICRYTIVSFRASLAGAAGADRWAAATSSTITNTEYYGVLLVKLGTGGSLDNRPACDLQKFPAVGRAGRDTYRVCGDIIRPTVAADGFAVLTFLNLKTFFT